MNRTLLREHSRFWLVLCLVTTRSAICQAEDRPNILFIYTDDHSYRTVSCYPEAYDWVRTPTIDRLAKEGMRFESAYIGTWCMPSRATLLTGHYQFGIQSMRMVGDYPGSAYDPAQCPFWPRIFREHGYYTAHIGKWHTGIDTGFGRDWDFQIVWNRPKHTKNHQNYYYDQPITYHGGETRNLSRYSTDQYTDWAVDFLKGKQVEGIARSAGKPWYLWLCYGAVHSPFTPADRHLDAYPDLKVSPPVDIFPPRPGKPEWAQHINFWEKGPDGTPMKAGRTFSSWVRQYHQGVLAIDEGIQRLLQTLHETGQRENTLIIFTSDQGFAWGQHGFRHKVAAYDATIRSPLIFSMPGRIKPGTVSPAPVGGVDIVPTIFKFAGIDFPWKMHGHDLSPLLENPLADWNYPVLMPATGRRYGSDTDILPRGRDAFHGQIPWYVMLRDGQYKYVRALIENELEELYDLSKDPEELDNLAVRPEHRAKLTELRDATIKVLRSKGARFVDEMPPVRERTGAENRSVPK